MCCLRIPTTFYHDEMNSISHHPMFGAKPRPISVLSQWRKFSFLSGGGGRAFNFSKSGEMLLFDVFAGRPFINEVLKCAKRIGISDFTTIYIQQMLMKKTKTYHMVKLNMNSFQESGGEAPRKIFENVSSIFA